MATISYLVAYLGTVVCVAIIAAKALDYLKKPQHIRWELYPVAHEEAHKVSYGGSYLEDTNWWKHKQHSSLYGSIKGIVVEFSVLHSTFHNNRSLWYRTYPFHFGIYMIFGMVFLALVACLFILLGIGDPLASLVYYLGNICAVVGFACIAFGAAGLIQRRMTLPDLRNFSTPEHFLNLGLFLGFAVLGLICCLAADQSFFAQFYAFLGSFFGFSFYDQGFLFSLFIIYMFALVAYIPATHMGHIFMKYFLWHDIRWGDTPTQDSVKIQENINTLLAYPVSWKAPHIQGDGKKTWAEVATTNPARPQE